jgi:hypothetical protein
MTTEKLITSLLPPNGCENRWQRNHSKA